MNKLENATKKYNQEIKKYISNNLYNEKTKTFTRNLKDERTDISL